MTLLYDEVFEKINTYNFKADKNNAFMRPREHFHPAEREHRRKPNPRLPVYVNVAMYRKDMIFDSSEHITY